MRNYLKYQIILFFCIMQFGYSQRSFIPVMADHAFYRAGSDSVYLELYTSFYKNNLKFIERDGRITGEYMISIKLSDNDSLRYSRKQSFRTSIDTTAGKGRIQQLVNIFVFKLPLEKFQADILVNDLNAGTKGEYQTEVKPAFGLSDSLELADIELASAISHADGSSEFNKNSLKVIPNPSGIYSPQQPMLYYYTELYNMDYLANQPSEYALEATINDAAGTVVRTLPTKIKEKRGSSAAVVDGFNVVTLPAGTYILNIKVTDRLLGQSRQRNKSFRITKSDDRTDSTAVWANGSGELALYAGFSEEEMNREFKYAAYIATPEENSIFNTLDTNGKRKFLSRFWKRQQAVHPGIKGSFKQDYFERFNYANANFGSIKREGWKTDRGRVLLTYGRPDDIEIQNMEMDKVPYQIWSYHDLEGGVLFIFADIQGTGFFELIHSTYSNEIYNPNWERLIQKAQGSGNFNMD